MRRTCVATIATALVSAAAVLAAVPAHADPLTGVPLIVKDAKNDVSGATTTEEKSVDILRAGFEYLPENHRRVKVIVECRRTFHAWKKQFAQQVRASFTDNLGQSWFITVGGWEGEGVRLYEVADDGTLSEVRIEGHAGGSMRINPKSGHVFRSFWIPVTTLGDDVETLSQLRAGSAYVWDKKVQASDITDAASETLTVSP